MKTHTIHWRSRSNGRTGTGTRLLDKDEAQRLADELNRDYPGIHHEAVCALPDSVDAAVARGASAARG